MKMSVILYNIRSLHNVGSIFRTADAAGFKKVYLAGITPAPLDEFGRERKEVSKVALGAEKFLEWDASARSSRAISKLLENLKKEGYKIYAVEQAKNSIPYTKVLDSRNPKLAVIMGDEVRGLPEFILKRADKILEIPMHGKKESLNVAVSFGIVAFELAKLNNLRG